MYSSASTIHQGVKANTDAKVLKATLALNWTGPYKVLSVPLQRLEVEKITVHQSVRGRGGVITVLY